MARKIRTASARTSRSGAPPLGPGRHLLNHVWLAALLLCSGLFLVVLITFAIGGEHGFLAMWRMQGDVAQLASEVRVIAQENRGLRNEIRRLRSDERYVEKIAREELGLVRPGELVFEFVE